MTTTTEQKKPARAKKKPASGEVATAEVQPIVMTAEQYELAIQEKIQTDISKYNLADTKIAEMKAEFAGLTVKGVDDKEGLKALKNALSTVVGTRTGIEKKRVELNADYLRITKAINGEATRLKVLIEEIEEPLKAEKKRIDEEIEEEKQRKQKEEEEKLKSRVEELKSAGMVFDGNFYAIANMSMDIGTVKNMNDSDFEFLVAKVKIEAERIRKEQEQREKEELARKEEERKQREKLEQEQKELEDQKKKMQEEREQFEKQREEFEAQQRKAAKDEEDRKAAILQELVNNRFAELERSGFTYSPASKVFTYQNEGGKHTIEAAVLETASPEYWIEILSQAAEAIGSINTKYKEIIESREEQKRKDIIAEQERKQKEEQEEKERREAEEKEAKERQEREAAEAEQERLAALPDVEKVYAYFQQLNSIEQPTVTNEHLVDMLTAWAHDMEEAETQIERELDQLHSAGE